MDIVNDYLGEILIGTGISILLGFFGAVRAFFSGIKKMESKLDELEDRLEANERLDTDTREWVKDIIKEKMKK